MSRHNDLVELLDWDTEFFGFNVARINADASQLNWSDIFDTLRNEKIKLTYLISPIAIENIPNADFEVSLVDNKCTYRKEIAPSLPLHPCIKTYGEAYPEKKLETLAIESGVYSRFNTDRKIGKQKFEALYREWIIKSVQKKIALEVLVFSNADNINGFVTLGEKNGRADIGIIAVDKNERGKGIGKALMSAAENSFHHHGYTAMQVVTQGENIAACKLYESCNFSLEKKEYVYHIWQN
jgi:dTDP-4-amino-4,6-dideoxy-D-galactose acyltransferase